jgi:hypothetical protein
LNLEICSAPEWGGFTFCATALSDGWSLCFLTGESKAMTQSELNRQIAKQTGESVADIARLGFTILTELPRDEDDEHQQSQTAVAQSK